MLILSKVRVIADCLALHGHLCPPEMLPFHETLEKFFRKNFQDEIRRLTADGASDQLTISSPVSRSQIGGASSYEQSSLTRSQSTTSTTRPPYVMPPLQVGHQPMSPPPLSPMITRGAILASDPPSGSKQTPLQRHLAHLARHGINGVSSAPGGGGDNGDTASLSIAESPHDSFVNVANGLPAAGFSNASVANSNLGSSVGSLKGRFSRFGSLNFGKRGHS